MGAPSQSLQNSQCSCPSSHPYFMTDSQGQSGCIKAADCPSMGGTLAELPADIFDYPSQSDYSQYESSCSIGYTLCNTNADCKDRFECMVPDDNYETCISLWCPLDDDCNIINSGCMDDCMVCKLYIYRFTYK